MTPMTVSDYLLERMAQKLGCLPFEVPLGQIDIGLVYKVRIYAKQCEPVDWTENGEPLYSQQDLERCLNAASRPSRPTGTP